MKIMSISIPDRDQSEEDITKSQINYIIHFVEEIEMDKVRKLGTKQALSFIEQNQRDRGKFVDKAATKFQKPAISVITVITIIVISAILIIVMN